MVDTSGHQCLAFHCTLCHSKHSFQFCRLPQPRDRFHGHSVFHVELRKIHFPCDCTKQNMCEELISGFAFSLFSNWFYVRRPVVRIWSGFYRFFVSPALHPFPAPCTRVSLDVFSTYNRSVCHWTSNPSLCPSRKSPLASERFLRLRPPLTRSTIVDRHSQPVPLTWSLFRPMQTKIKWNF